MSTSKALLLKFAPCAALFGRACANMLFHVWNVYMWLRVHWGSVAASDIRLIGEWVTAHFVRIRRDAVTSMDDWGLLDTLGAPFCPLESTWM